MFSIIEETLEADPLGLLKIRQHFSGYLCDVIIVFNKRNPDSTHLKITYHFWFKWHHYLIYGLFWPYMFFKMRQYAKRLKILIERLG